MEDLSSASARRNERRMSDDVHKTTRIAHPPRLDPPVSSRASLSQNVSYEDKENDDMTVSARNASSSDKKEAPVKEELTPMDHVHRVLVSLEQAYPFFFGATTPQQRAFVRSATSPPGILKGVYTNPGITAVLATLVGFLCGLLLAQRSLTTKSPGGNVSDSCRRVVSDILRFA